MDLRMSIHCLKDKVVERMPTNEAYSSTKTI